MFAFFNAEGNDEITGLLVRANPTFAYREFDGVDIAKGIEYETEKRKLEEAGFSYKIIRSDPELKRMLREIRFAEKIKGIARSLRGGKRSRRSRKKSTYRRRTFKR